MAPGARIPITNGGGKSPRWSHDGKELFYVAPDGSLISVPISISRDQKAIEPAKPTLLVPSRNNAGGYTDPSKPKFTVTPDGQKFLMVVGEEAPIPEATGKVMRVMESPSRPYWRAILTFYVLARAWS
jgi:hypothetical protein